MSYKTAARILGLPARLARKALPDGALEQLSFEMRSMLGRRSARRLELDPARTNLLDLGAADTPAGDFIAVDFFGRDGVYGADLRYPLLIDDASVDGIFTEHTFEHMAFEDVRRLVAECFRVLKPRGRIRVIVPDVSIFVARYQANDLAWFGEWERVTLQPRGRQFVTPMQAISFITQEYGHRSAWDFATLAKVLGDAGFVEVEAAGYRQGRDPRLLRDKDADSRRLVSLYAEAVKPT
ncbi:MAG: class I SAM-dependent methyltransferase [Gammaproteobacteria bacterium]